MKQKHHVRVEFSPWGSPELDDALIPVEDVDKAGSVEEAFTHITGLPATAITFFTVDEHYDEHGDLIRDAGEG